MADILDDDESGETFADSIDEVLVDSAGVNADALLHDTVVPVALSALAAEAVNGQVAFLAVAVESVFVEYLIRSASVTPSSPAVFDFSGGFAARSVATVVVVVGKRSDCQKQYEEQRFAHECQIDIDKNIMPGKENKLIRRWRTKPPLPPCAAHQHPNHPPDPFIFYHLPYCEKTGTLIQRLQESGYFSFW